MTAQQARRWLIYSSLSACGVFFVFLLIAPAIGFPLEWKDALRIIELVVPVFLGYLGAAAHYVFGSKRKESILAGHQRDLMGLMTKGPVILFSVMCGTVLLAFGYSNRSNALTGAGMSVDTLAAAFTAALGILTVTTNVAVAHLFSFDQGDVGKDVADAQGSP